MLFSQGWKEPKGEPNNTFPEPAIEMRDYQGSSHGEGQE
jgi:hypothetical protein